MADNVTITERELSRVERFIDARLTKIESTIEAALHSLSTEDKNLQKQIQLLVLEIEILKREKESDRRWVAAIGGGAGFLISVGIQIAKMFLE